MANLRDKLERIREKSFMLQETLSNPGTMQDQARFQKLAKELAELKKIVELYDQFSKAEKDLQDLEEHLKVPDLDSEMKALYREEISALENKKAELLVQIEDELLREGDPNANRDVIVEIRAGTGGEEAALFSAEMFRMYSKYAANHGLQTEVMSSNPTGIGGFKEIIFSVSGPQAYSFLKFEGGIHRVQRVPKTEGSGRVHTSAVTVAIMAEADDSELVIEPKDLRIDVYRASGAGGQHVNKTESAVRITHLPSGLVVSCQDERSQHKNKAKAMRVLRARLYDAMQQKQHQEMATQRKAMVGTGDRSGKIRTYNFPDQRVTEHRIGLTLHSLDDILDGHLDEITQALARHEREQKLNSAA